MGNETVALSTKALLRRMDETAVVTHVVVTVKPDHFPGMIDGQRDILVNGSQVGGVMVWVGSIGDFYPGSTTTSGQFSPEDRNDAFEGFIDFALESTANSMRRPERILAAARPMSPDVVIVSPKRLREKDISIYGARRITPGQSLFLFLGPCKADQISRVRFERSLRQRGYK
jgi:hypothetical protein